MTRPSPPRQIVSVWFPQLAMDRWRVITRRVRTLPDADVPVVLACEGPHGPVIHAASDVALRRGIAPGTRVVDVQSVHPDLHVEPADPDGDAQMLERLALWSRRWCPWTVRDTENGITLDVTGSVHLFGGKVALLREIHDRFAMQGLMARPAMAPTRGAAQALARHGPASAICVPDRIDACLAPLPVSALRLDQDTVRLLQRLGLKTIGALANVPRDALMRRFATLSPDVNPLVLLDRAMGHVPEPLNAPSEPDRFITRARLAEPVMDPVPHLPDLAHRLCADLTKAGRGARMLRVTVYRVDGEWRFVDVATARATCDAAHILRLLDGKTDQVNPGFGFDLVTLEAVRSEPLAAAQITLDKTRDVEADVSVLVDRLTARLGRNKVLWPRWHESHVPERVVSASPALGHVSAAAPDIARERPLRLLDRPEELRVLYAVPEGPPVRFRWRGIDHCATRHEGPERIAPEWWHDRPGTRLRDYYKVEVDDGRRFWLYREGLPDDGRGGAPEWFLHGFFA